MFRNKYLHNISLVRLVKNARNATQLTFPARTSGVNRKTRDVVKIFYSLARHYQVLRVAAFTLCMSNSTDIHCGIWRLAGIESKQSQR